MSQEKLNKTLINWDLVSVNPNDKNWDWKDLFCFWAVNIQSVIGFSLITSLYVLYDLNTFVVFFGSLIGVILVYFFSNLIGKPSQKFGLPYVVLLRSSFGFRGAKYFGFVRGIVGIFMFGIQTYFLSKAISYLIRISFFSFDNDFLNNEIFLIFLLGLNIVDWASIIITIFFQFILFSVGMNFNKKIIRFSSYIVYLGIISFFFIVLLSDVKFTLHAFLEILNLNNFLDYNNLAPLMTVSGTIFAYFSILILNFGDFSRYVKNEKELNKGNLSLLINLFAFSFFALFIVTGADAFLKLNLNPENIKVIFTNPTDIIGKLDNLLITVLALIFIILASLSTNLIANFIPSQFSLINLAPSSLSFKSSSVIISILGFIIGAFWLTILSHVSILSFFDILGCLFGPIFGIVISDYYIIRKDNLISKDLYSTDKNSEYYFSGGWNLKAIYSLFVGFIFSVSIIWNADLSFIQTYSWIIGALVSSFTYYLLAKE